MIGRSRTLDSEFSFAIGMARAALEAGVRAGAPPRRGAVIAAHHACLRNELTVRGDELGPCQSAAGNEGNRRHALEACTTFGA